MMTIAATASAFAGPRTPIREFFTEHVDLSVPGLAGIAAKLEADDIAGAEKIFADHIRANLRTEQVCKEWFEKKYTPAQVSNLTARAATVMDYTLSSCATSPTTR